LNLIPLLPATIDGARVNAVNARNLHGFLESKQEFANWIKDRIEAYGFTGNKDLRVFDDLIKNPKGGRPTKEYALTLDMAKELAMAEGAGQGCRGQRRPFSELSEKAARTGRSHSMK